MEMISLHNHSDHSVGDCLLTVPEYLDWAAKYETGYVGLTDHGVVGGLPEFIWGAHERGLTPIAGCEFYYRHLPPAAEESMRGQTAHLVVLALTKQGFENLIELTTAANKTPALIGRNYRGVLSFDSLRLRSEGLFILSACIGGYPSRHILKHEGELPDEFDEFLGEFRHQFAFEVQLAGHPDQDYLLHHYLNLGRKYGVPVIPTMDAHYRDRDDARAHRVMVATAQNTPVDALRAYQEDGYYLPTLEQWEARWSAIQGLTSPLHVAEQVESYDIGYPGVRFPISHAEGFPKLREVVIAAFRQKQGRFKNIAQYRDRLNHELKAIHTGRLGGYLYMVQDLMGFCRSQGMLMGPGRGSAGGSLVCYLAGITGIDPIQHDLIFERFWNPGRAEVVVDGDEEFLKGHLPDIDIDMGQSSRELALGYLAEKYGDIYPILTYTTLAARAALRDACRAYNFSEGDIDLVTKDIEVKHGRVQSLAQAVETSPMLKAFANQAPHVVNAALKMEGRKRHFSVHASGYGISAFAPAGLVPIVSILDRRSTETGSHIRRVYGYDMHVLERLGWGKIDLLGLRTLDAARITLGLLGARDWSDLKETPETREKTWGLLRTGNLTGTFQLENAASRLCTQVHPRSLQELIDIVALIRPGAMDDVERYLDVKWHDAEWDTGIPELNTIVAPTKGVLLYQEQVMAFASTVADLTLAEADDLRRAVGKKDPVLMRQQMKKLRDRMTNKGYSQAQQDSAVAIIEKHADYSFNRAHATGYGKMASWTSFLKANHPREFFFGLLECIGDERQKAQERLGLYLQDMWSLGIKARFQDLTELSSSNTFPKDPDEGIILTPALIKGLGEKGMGALADALKDLTHPLEIFSTLAQTVSKTVLRTLGMLGIGAKTLFPNTASFAEAYRNLNFMVVLHRILSPGEWKQLLESYHEVSGEGLPVEQLYQDVRNIIEQDLDVKEEGNTLRMKSNRRTRLAKLEVLKELETIWTMSVQEMMMQRARAEMAYVGNLIHPITAPSGQRITALMQLPNLRPRTQFWVSGFVTDLKEASYARGVEKKRYLRFRVTDGTGTQQFAAFPDRIQKVVRKYVGEALLFHMQSADKRGRYRILEVEPLGEAS